MRDSGTSTDFHKKYESHSILGSILKKIATEKIQSNTQNLLGMLPVSARSFMSPLQIPGSGQQTFAEHAQSMMPEKSDPIENLLFTYTSWLNSIISYVFSNPHKVNNVIAEIKPFQDLVFNNAIQVLKQRYTKNTPQLDAWQSKKLQFFQWAIWCEDEGWKLKSAINELIFDDPNFQAFRYMKNLEPFHQKALMEPWHKNTRMSCLYSVEIVLGTLIQLMKKIDSSDQSNVTIQELIAVLAVEQFEIDRQGWDKSPGSLAFAFIHSFFLKLANNPIIQSLKFAPPPPCGPPVTPVNDFGPEFQIRPFGISNYTIISLLEYIISTVVKLPGDASLSEDPKINESQTLLIEKIRKAFFERFEIRFMMKIGLFTRKQIESALTTYPLRTGARTLLFSQKTLKAIFVEDEPVIENPPADQAMDAEDRTMQDEPSIVSRKFV